MDVVRLASFGLRLTCPGHAGVVDAVQAELDAQPGPRITADVVQDLAVFHGPCDEPSLHAKVARAIVNALGPDGLRSYFEPITD